MNALSVIDSPLQGHYLAEIMKCCLISPNATKYITKLNKKIVWSKADAVFWKKVQDYKDGSGLQFNKFGLVTRGQEIKDSFLVEF